MVYNSTKREYYTGYIRELYPVYARMGRLRIDELNHFLFLLSRIARIESTLLLAEGFHP